MILQDKPIAGTYKFLVTLVNPRTEDEASFTIGTECDSFTAVQRAISAERSERGLKGYLFFESLELTAPF
jgi:hypothetical protein